MIGSVIQLWETLWREDPESQGDKQSSISEEKGTPKTVDSRAACKAEGGSQRSS